MNIHAGKLKLSGAADLKGIAIYSLSGQRITLPAGSLNALKSGAAIDLPSFSRGVYLIQIKTATGVTSHIFIR